MEDRRQGDRRETERRTNGHQYLATLRALFDADDEVEATLIANQISENARADLDEDQVVEVTQVMAYSISMPVEPAELVAKMRGVRDMLICTRIKQCFDLAKQIDEMAWVLENRAEETFEHTGMAGYDHGAIFALAEKLLGRKA